MAEDIQQEAEQKSIEQTSTKTQVAEIPEKKSTGWLIFGIVNLILILILSGALFYLLQELKDRQSAQSTEINKDDLRSIEASKQLNAFQTQLGAMQSQIAAFSKDIAGKDSHFTKTLADFSQLHSEKLDMSENELTDEIAQIKRQLGKTRGDWLIADAEYLLSVANQRLHLVGDVKTASMALEAADQRLRESGDAAVYKVREQIAKEIASLKTVDVVDVVGIFSKIQLLKDSSEQLAVLLPYAGKPLTESKQIHAHKEEQNAEHGVLDLALNLLEGYVTVRHSDQPISHILTEEEVSFIRQQLNVKLEMIKIALVQQNDALYKASILDSKQWLSGNFTLNDAAKHFVTELNNFNSIPMQSQFPDVSQSFKMLKDIIKLRLESDKGQVQPKDNTATEEAIIAPTSL